MTVENPKSNLAGDAVIARTVDALNSRNVVTTVAENGEAAKQMLISLIPAGAEIFASTSETLDSIGFTDYLHHANLYRDLHLALDQEADPEKQRELRRLASVAEYVIGSVQAIAETGEVVIASASGSQMGAYAYGAKNLIWVAGTQKICPTLDDALARVRGFSAERHQQWQVEQGRRPSSLGKLMILERESAPERIKMILIKENLGW